MRILAAFATVCFAIAGAAQAQEPSYSHTLNEQLERVQAGKAAVPTRNDMPAAAAAAARPLPVAPGGERIDSVGGDAIPALPLKIQTAPGGVMYVTGGVGEEEKQELTAVASEYNLQALFATKTGEYMSGVNVRIADGKGENVLTVDNAGPFLYVQLAPGSYTLQAATAKAGMQTAKIRVPAKGTVKPVVRF